jgi:signal transduction histidine kinase/ActR/RegA family two-component response regulator
MGNVTSPDFRALFQAVPGLYLALTPDLRIVAVSDAYLLATMTTAEGILGRGIFEVFPDNPNDPAASGVHNLRASLERVLRTSQADVMPVQKYDIRRPQAEGGGFEERYWSPLNAPVLGPDGTVAYIIHRAEDVTEFVRLKQFGREREEMAQALQNRALRMEAEVYERAQQVAEANRKLTDANDALARLYRQIALLMQRADDELRGGEASGGDWEKLRDTITPEEMLGRVAQLIVGHKNLEAQLRQAQKMEAVGRLAGGVAHDFNNLLTVIIGCVEILREDSPNRAASEELQEIDKAATRAAALTHKLLAFSRKQIMQPRVINPNSVVAGMEELLRRLIGEDIQLVTVLGSAVGKVLADSNQIEQVIMNLVVNARDAMPKGGRIVIETRNISVGADFRSLRPGAYVSVTVTDTGHGMEQQTAARVFEPFFTTKEIGKGTGLGLSTVYGIIEQSGGTVTVQSAPGAGATFRVYLPVADAAEEPQASEQHAAAVATLPATVLLVEDEAALRRLISTALAAAGYRVLQAANGDEAMALASGPHRIDLLLTDVVMPGISSPDRVGRLRANRPDCAVLYISGYDNELIDLKTLERTDSFLAKPFTPRSLLTRISELLAAQRRRNTGAVFNERSIG